MSLKQLKEIDSGTGFDRMVAAHAAGAQLASIFHAAEASA